MQTGNFLTGRGSSIADASVLVMNQQSPVKRADTPVILFLFPFKDICL